MHLIRSKKSLKNKRNLEISFLSSLILILFLIQIINISPSSSPNHKISEHQNFTTFNDELKIAAEDEILFQGTEDPLNITDNGNLYEINQEVSLTNEEELNLTYYLDAEHDWKVSEIKNSITNIQETREWVNDSNFDSLDVVLHTIETVNDTNGLYDDDSIKTDNVIVFSELGAVAMRVYFETMIFETDYDFLFIEDEFDNLCFQDTGVRYKFYSPWVMGDQLQVYYVSDDSYNYFGYNITSYQYLTGISDLNSWDFNNESVSMTSYGYGLIENNTAMYVSLFSDRFFSGWSEGYYANYSKYDYSEIYQNLTVPRGAVIDAYFSFDYFAQFAMESNDFSFYVELNKQKIYSIGFADIVDVGRNTWHSTRKINIDLWVNNSNIFNNVINEQELNISIGIKSGSSAFYAGYQDRYQQTIWFDNLSLVLTTIANSSQEGINLKINDKVLQEEHHWGESSLGLYGLWETNPVFLTFNTTSPSITLKLNTTLYGYHNTTSRINQQNDEGISYKILSNGTIYWEFLHNLYMPSQFTDFEFILGKPVNWKFLSVLDPTLQSRPFEGGDIGDNSLKINISNAVYPGWWTFKATSPNYLNITNTKMLKNGQWTQSSFKSGESTKIKTNITYNNDNPPDLNYTLVNLLIYDPQERLWYNNSIAPELNGEVIFSLIQFTSKNTIGGVYTYMLLWSNGTALGGVSSSFIISHESKLELLKPDEAEEDLRLEAFLGDIIPLRVYLYDDENDLPISGAVVYYEWDDGEKEYLEEASPGVYEATIETDDFESTGLYEIEIHASKVGFSSSDITLELDLTEETDLLFWIIIAALIGIISILCVLSLRSYVFIPRKHRKEADLIAKTQRFKDLQNTQAVVIIHKSGGLPVFLKSYSILEHQKKELFSGFIHAITTIGEEISGKRTVISEGEDIKKEERVLEIDFKHFHCLIADKGDVRTIFILRDKSSERLRKLVKDFSLYIYSKLKDRFASWDGSLDEFEKEIPPILNEHFELFYKEPCKLTKPEIMAKIRKEDELNSMELRILNVIYSLLKGKGKSEFYLDYILEVVHEENKDLIIESIETLIDRKIIIPSTDEKYK